MGSVYQFPIPSFSAVTRPSMLANPVFSLKEIAYRHSVSSIRAADGSQRRRPSNNPIYRRKPNGGGGEDDMHSHDGKTLSPAAKEEILALFKRIQLSVAKGGSSNSKKLGSQPPETAKLLLEVLRNSGSQKGKVSGKKSDKMLSPRNDSRKKEDSTEPPSLTISKTIRLPSNFRRKSSIPVSSSRDEFELKSELLEESEPLEENREHESNKLEDMKLTELKEIAKSKGIKGYSKLKKGELVELLISL